MSNLSAVMRHVTKIEPAMMYANAKASSRSVEELILSFKDAVLVRVVQWECVCMRERERERKRQRDEGKMAGGGSDVATSNREEKKSDNQQTGQAPDLAHVCENVFPRRLLLYMLFR